MTRLTQLDDPWWIWPVIALIGVALGAASVYPYAYTAGPLHFLGNSAALWLLAAFAVGAIAGNSARGAAAGALLLIATVLAFFAIYKALFPTDEVRQVATFWLSTAVVGGVVFGFVGGVWRKGDSLRRGVAAAFVGSAFISEAISFPPVAGERWRWIEVFAGVAFCFLIATDRRSKLVTLVALPACVVLGVLGWAVTKHAIHVTLA